MEELEKKVSLLKIAEEIIDYINENKGYKN